MVRSPRHLRRHPGPLVAGVAVFLTGCVASSVGVYVQDHGTEADHLLLEAEGLLGIGLDRSDSFRAPIAIEIVRVLEPGAHGYKAPGTACHESLRAPPSLAPLAHEIGHALGLDHVDDTANLMSRSASGRTITDRQLAAMADRAWRLESAWCRSIRGD